jgi:predicted nucleic acid-binding protein
MSAANAAVSAGCIPVTNNKSEFVRVAGLIVEDWLVS